MLIIMTDISIKNIFEKIPASLNEEFYEDIITSGNFKLERIVSEGQSTPENFWYDQDKNEFVILIRGSAELLFENDEKIKLKPGDYLIIPAHKKHRVLKTDTTQKTFWLALHY